MGHFSLVRFFFSTLVTLGLLFGLGHVNQSAWAASGDYLCFVKRGGDIRNNADGFHHLGYKIENGFNRQHHRSCTEQIQFQPVSDEVNTEGNFVIKLTKPLVINGAHDNPCQGDHPLCEDPDISFAMTGHGSDHPVVIDTTDIQDDRCAIRINTPSDGGWMVFTDFTVRSKQNNLSSEVEPGQSTDAAICLEGGEQVVITRVELDTDASEGAVCGNGEIEEGESCDAGEQNGDSCSGCNTNCEKFVVPDTCDDNNACLTGPDYDGDGLADDNFECDDDIDGDGVPEAVDNCSARKKNPATDKTYFEEIHTDASLSDDEKRARLLSFGNAAQFDADGDGHGDHCDDNADDDDFPNNDNGDQNPNVNPQDGADNCPFHPNNDQADWNNDGQGDACDDEIPPPPDDDDDDIPDEEDNCPDVTNPAGENGEQPDVDGDGIGDACDDDIDGDGLPNDVEEADELCLSPSDADSDFDGLPDGPGEDGLDEVDPCPCVADTACTDPDVDDVDGDGVSNDFDNCPNLPNGDQLDDDDDGTGNACDPDIPDGDADEDGVLNIDDNCPTVANATQEDLDGDELGDACDPNPNLGEGVQNEADIPEPTGSGCFNSLQTKTHPDVFTWLSFVFLALGVQLFRRSPEE